MGLSNPSQLKPEYIMQRVTYHTTKPLSEIYEYLTKGQLLNADIPESYKKYWDIADAHRFTS